jgi:hypothetical protein
MKTIYEQTGWKRPFPQMICQDPEVLLKITEFDFDLDNEGFIDYFISRTGIMYGYSDDPELAEQLLMSDDPPRYQKIVKGRLQDCWELYLN